MRGARPAFFVLVSTLLAFAAAPCAGADVTTFHVDAARDGWNDLETRLTQANAGGLQRVATYRLDGEADAQPLYLHDANVAGKRRSLVFVATESDTLYAFAPRRGLVWRRHFGTPVPARAARRCRAPAPSVGIAGTPVIDVRTDTLYVVTDALVRGKPALVLHALAPGTGREKRSVDLSARVGDPATHLQRPGLLEANGRIYVAFGSFCDAAPERTYGRILAYDARSLAFADAFVTTASPRCPAFHLGGIWAMGFAPAADARGNVYVSTGNGCIDYARPANGGYADAVLRLTPDLRLANVHAALFAPCDAVRENARDQELGSGGVVLVPGTRFLVAGGKTGVTYVLERSNLGGFRAHCPDRVPFAAETNWGLWGGPVVWRSGARTYVAIAGTGPAGVRVFALDAARGILVPAGESGVPLYDGGESGTITSNGAEPASFVLWLLTRPVSGSIDLVAYDPLRLRHPLVSVAAGMWTNARAYAALTPTIADGFAFVASDRLLTVWQTPPTSASGLRRRAAGRTRGAR